MRHIKGNVMDLKSILIVGVLLIGIPNVSAQSTDNTFDLRSSRYKTEASERFESPLYKSDKFVVFPPRPRIKTNPTLRDIKANDMTVSTSFCTKGGSYNKLSLSVLLTANAAWISKQESELIATQVEQSMSERCPNVMVTTIDFYFDPVMFDSFGSIITLSDHIESRINEAPVVTVGLHNHRLSYSKFKFERMLKERNAFELGLKVTLNDLLNFKRNYDRLASEQKAQAQAKRHEENKIKRAEMLKKEPVQPKELVVGGLHFQKDKYGGSNLYVMYAPAISGTQTGREEVQRNYLRQMYDLIEKHHSEYPILVDYTNIASAFSVDDYSHCDVLNSGFALPAIRTVGFERPVLLFYTTGFDRKVLAEFSEFKRSTNQLSSANWNSVEQSSLSGTTADFENGGFHAANSSFFIGYAPDGEQYAMSMWGDKNAIPLELAKALYEYSAIGQRVVDVNRGVSRDVVIYERKTSYDVFPEYNLLKFYHSLLQFYADWGLSGKPSIRALAPSDYAKDEYANLFERFIDDLGSNKANCEGRRIGVISHDRIEAIRAAREKRMRAMAEAFFSRFDGPACQTETVMEIYGMADPCW